MFSVKFVFPPSQYELVNAAVAGISKEVSQLGAARYIVFGSTSIINYHVITGVDDKCLSYHI